MMKLNNQLVNKIILCIFISISFFVPVILIAQDTTILDNVTIKGRKKTEKERAEFCNHGQMTEVLIEEELNRNNPAFIEQSLGTMAGVQVDKRTQVGGQRIVIRGYGNDQKFNNWGVKMYYNQIPITNAEGITVLDDIDFSLINNIEVIKGPASTMYGSGVGGVVRFYLKPSNEKGVSVEQNTTAGSFGLLQTKSKINYVTDNAAMFVSYGHIQSDGYRPRGNSLKNFLTYYADFKLSNNNALSIFASHNYSNESTTGQIPYEQYYAGLDSGNAAYAKKNARVEFLSTRLGASANFKLTPLLSNMTTLFYSNTEGRTISAGADGNTSTANFGIRSTFIIKNNISNSFENSFNVGTEIQQTQALASSWSFTGTDDNLPMQTASLASKGSFFKFITNQISVFAIDRVTYKPLNLSIILGISSNNINYTRKDILSNAGLVAGYNKDLSFDKTFKPTYNPHIALQKTFLKQILNISYSEGYNAPTATASFIGTINISNESLVPEQAKMLEFSAQGLLFDTKLDYQISFFGMSINNKLTQLSGINPAGGTYTYWSNTGNQSNNGVEASIGYVHESKSKNIIRKISPFITYAYYNFTYTSFTTLFGGALKDYSGQRVVGVPMQKLSIGLDIFHTHGFYINTTYNYLSDIYTDFANTNNVKGYAMLNSKLGFKHKYKKFEMEMFVAGNNLTSQINYTFLFLGNSVGDSDSGSGYAKNVATDVNPGPNKIYFFGGLNLKFHL